MVLEAACRYNLDTHIIKIISEAVELLYTAWSTLEETTEWKTSTPGGKAAGRHYQHHCLSIWACQSEGNYMFIVEFGLALCKEKLIRYPSKPQHAYYEHLIWCKNNIPPGLIGTCKEATQMPQAIGSTQTSDRDFHHVACCNGSGYMEDTVIAYRQYYLASRRTMSGYTNRDRPEWFSKDKCIRWETLAAKDKPELCVYDKDSLYRRTYNRTT